MASSSSASTLPVPQLNLRADSRGRPVYIISDLHLAGGLNRNGNYDGTENFYADLSFVRFLDHLQQQSAEPGALLIINGDFIDYLRIKDYPEADDQFSTWSSMLQKVGINKSAAELKSSITKKELKYGLK